MFFQLRSSNMCECNMDWLNLTYYFRSIWLRPWPLTSLTKKLLWSMSPIPNQLGSPNIVCEWYLGMLVECSLLFIGQCDFDLCYLDTILHWGHLSLYCDPALVLLVISSWNFHGVCQRFLCNQKQNPSWIRQKMRHFSIDPHCKNRSLW